MNTNMSHTLIKCFNLAALLVLAAGGCNKGSPVPAKSYKDLRYAELSKLNIPRPQRFELQNGMVVYLIEDHALPLVNASATVRVGSRWEPVNKAGLASITGTVMRTGGTTTHNGDQLDEELDRLGAVVETFAGGDSGGAYLSVLKEDADRGLTLLADILRNPKFPEDKIEIAKIAERNAISRRNDDPAPIVFREFDRILYGKDTAYGHITEYKTIKAISRDDIVKFHKAFFQPESVMIGVWGDFSAQEMRATIERAFGGWPRGGHPKPAVPEVDSTARDRRGLYFINKDDVNQSWVLTGSLGGKRNDPDFYALTVMSNVLGGGFASRLFNQVRTAQGLAYEVSSGWNAEWDRPGTFLAMGGTKSETTVQMLNAIRHEIQLLAASGATDEEITRAKDGILKGFAFEFDSKRRVVERMMYYEYYGYPADYLQNYMENIGRVTKEDVQRVARQSLDNDKFITLVLGNSKNFDKALDTLGKVTPIDVSIPPDN
jgi:zinc protease